MLPPGLVVAGEAVRLKLNGGAEFVPFWLAAKLTVGAAPALTVIAVEVCTPPSTSVAFAVMEYVPVATFAQETV